MGKIALTVDMFSRAKQEKSRNISENVKWGLKKRMRDGKAIVNCNRFMGYDKNENGQLVINEQEAKVVERIFREYVEGKGVAAIGKGLGRDRIPTVSGKYKWYDSVVRRMPRNEECYGKLLLQKTVTLDYMTKYRAVKNYHTEQYRVENNHEPIISKELF
jgi:DNA invertase Pin-like site-specific DNA recombinase